ncbi:MAG: hypothetical protein AAB691_02510 [Patescibacteria group bacterium]
MATTIAGFVLRATNRQETARFYAELGLHTREHKHGGPAHHEVMPMADTCVMEIYAASPDFPKDALMLIVDSIETALQVASEFGIQATTDVSVLEDTKFVYITDPDGRPVLLIENK